MPWDDPKVFALLLVVAGVLSVGTLVGLLLRVLGRGPGVQKVARDVLVRTGSWWLMAGLMVAAVLVGRTVTLVLFAGLSFLALREFLSISKTRRGDHRTLLWAFFVILPLHYFLVGAGWYPVFTIFIPVYAFLFLALRSAIVDDPADYLSRTARIQWGVMICVYMLSHVPAILFFLDEIPGWPHSPVILLLFYVLVGQGCDVLQYAWGKALGRHKILPVISPNKTWEGFLGGVLSAAGVAAALSPLTPFLWWQAAAIGLMIGMVGFLGDIVLSAVKRDAGIKDYGAMIAGHGGVLDRVDSLVFSAPIFFHVVRYYFTV